MVENLDFSNGQTFLDPCCGSGAFLLTIDNVKPSQLFGIDIDPIAVFIKSDGTIFVNDEETKFNKIPQVVSELTMKDYSTKIFVLGDKNNLYGRIISVVDVLNSAGFLDVVLVTDLSNNLTKEIEQNKNN